MTDLALIQDDGPARPYDVPVHDPVARVAAMARAAARRGGERWLEHGGQLVDVIGDAMDEFEAELRGLAGH